MHYSKVKQFVSIAVKKSIDIEDIKQCKDYSEYIEYESTYVELELMESSNVLEEKEFDLCKEVIKEYAK